VHLKCSLFIDGERSNKSKDDGNNFMAIAIILEKSIPLLAFKY
jgi:hypothetical protein